LALPPADWLFNVLLIVCYRVFRPNVVGFVVVVRWFSSVAALTNPDKNQKPRKLKKPRVSSVCFKQNFCRRPNWRANGEKKKKKKMYKSPNNKTNNHDRLSSGRLEIAEILFSRDEQTRKKEKGDSERVR